MLAILVALAIPLSARASDAYVTPSRSDAATVGRRIEAPPLLAACPVDGTHEFIDSWGFARSGGRRHQGVDMIAERGTPVVAVRDGVVEFTQNRLGGRSIWLSTESGDEFYYAHLSGWEGEGREVEAGDVIGYVGSSGNARGPHLHFETHPRGQVTNPYPTTVAACTPPIRIDDTNDWLCGDVVTSSRVADERIRRDLEESCPDDAG